MKKVIVRTLSCFIPVQKWRKKFRSRFGMTVEDVICLNLRHEQNAVHCKPCQTSKDIEPFTIGITTYNKRFETYFKPLIKQIRKKFDGDIIVTINGNYNEEFDQTYRKEVLRFLSNYDRVYPMFFTGFRSLAKLWNNCLINSPTNYLLLLNDDISIEDEFWTHLSACILENQYRSFKMNKSWCYVFLNREEVRNVGWFDERYLGIGHEDIDFEARWFEKYNFFLPQFIDVPGLKSFSEKKDALVNQRTHSDKYSLFNKEFFFQKFKVTKPGKPYKHKIEDMPQYPYEDFYWKNKNKL